MRSKKYHTITEPPPNYVIPDVASSASNQLTCLDYSQKRINVFAFCFRNKFFVFSAFYDRRKGQKIIRVIGATRTRGPEKVWCRLWYKTNEFNSSSHVSVTVAAQTKVIRENWNLKYSACFVMCLLTNKTVPTAVSIVARVKDPPSNLLAVINNYNETVTTPQNKFGVCVKPLHFDYNRSDF
nr:uncharacterized protein LOC111512394 [Leptinotarsa decemlineata]